MNSGKEIYYQVLVFPARDTQLHAPDSYIDGDKLSLSEAIIRAKNIEALGWCYTAILVQNWREL